MRTESVISPTEMDLISMQRTPTLTLRETLFPQQHAPPWQKILVVVYYALAITSLVLVILFTLQYLDSRSDGTRVVEEDALLKAQSAKSGLIDAIESVETEVSKIVEGIASAMSDGFNIGQRNIAG